MRIFSTKKSRLLLACILSVIILLLITYLFKNDRYKSSLFYNLIRSPHKMQAARALFKPIDFRIDFFGMVYEGRSGNILDDSIIYFGAFEKPILFFMGDVAGSLGKDEIIFFDIGANVGQHSLFMSKYAKEVHAFEPYPPVLERFKKLLAINHIENIFIHPVGLGNKNGQILFFEPPDSDLGVGSFIHREGTTKSKSLPLVVGDEWLKKIGLSRVDIIKCDIEGYEKLALLGLRHTLENNRPIIIMELNLGLDDSFQSIDDFYATFPPDYEFLLFCVEEPYTGRYELCQYDKLDFNKRERYNIVVYPREKKGYIKVRKKGEH